MTHPLSPQPRPTTLAWKTSSYSGTGDGQNCVEIAKTQETIALRDTKDRAAGTFHLASRDWQSLLAQIKRH